MAHTTADRFAAARKRIQETGTAYNAAKQASAPESELRNLRKRYKRALTKFRNMVRADRLRTLGTP